MNTCTLGSHCCWVTCLLIAAGWLLASSGLLFLSWNKVICAFAKVKQAKYWQALLLVATVAVFCAPRFYMLRKMGHQKCCHKAHGECPYSRDSQADDESSDSKQPDKNKK